MKGTRHSEEQIIAVLKQGEAGLTTAELAAVSDWVSTGKVIRMLTLVDDCTRECPAHRG